MSTKKVVAKKRWSNTDYLHVNPQIGDYLKVYRDKPVFVIPADAASYEKMVLQMAEAMEKESLFNANYHIPFAMVALAAIGINEPRK